MTGALRAGERVLLRDAKGRRYLVALVAGETFHFHGGALAHDDLIGRPEGTAVRTNLDARLTAFRPRLADYLLKMGRGAQVIYPKDLGAILVWADVFPGAHVLEAGTGSGALTLGLCRAAGAGGRVVSYEVREEHQAVGRENIERFSGEMPEGLDLRVGDVREVGATGETFDRVLLDMPEPWGVLAEVTAALRSGGILCGWLPTTGQVQQLTAEMERAGYGELESFELLLRTWHVTPRSMRPDHRMVAHTGFITVGRLLASE